MKIVSEKWKYPQPHMASMHPEAPSDKVNQITDFIKRIVEDSQSQGVIIGLSGGLDSALVTRLAVQALGPNRVHTVYMPSKTSPNDDERSTRSLSVLYGTIHQVIGIDSIVGAASVTLDSIQDRIAIGNIMARSRMMILYNLAKKRNLLVLGTGNRSEIMMGYFTKYGDGACDALPIGGLYKTEVRAMSIQLGVPEEFLIRAPSAGLWKGQTDEEEMGVTYDELDKILKLLENGMSENKIAAVSGSSLRTVNRVLERVRLNDHKRKFPPTPDIQ